MRIRVAIAVLGTMTMAPATLLAGDKFQSSLVNPVAAPAAAPPALTGPIGASWTNGTSKGTVKNSNCKLQVQLKGITLANSDQMPGTGDEVICLGESNVTLQAASIGANSVVLRGEVKNGAVLQFRPRRSADHPRVKLAASSGM